ncbi:MAG: L,D-transpeptidase family protein [Phycisphaerae bacterium]|nr:L,D-transpeptidase family protein [Phycisphaerae bacterium]
MARRRAHGGLRRILGGLFFVTLVAGAFWWGLPLFQAANKATGPSPDNLLRSTETPSGGSASLRPPVEPVLKPVTPTPTSSPAGGGTSARVTSPSVPTSQPSPRVGAEQGLADYQAGLAALAREDAVEARSRLSAAIERGLARPRAEDARAKLSEINERMIFSPERLTEDPLVDSYRVKPGDSVAKIAKAHSISEEFVAQVNRLPNKDFIRVGQTLKVANGPFHAVVDKSDHELSIFLGNTFIRSFRVALGEHGSTPTGKWNVKDHLVNPSWVDPRTGKRWHADDPQNPIGEYWIGLEGIEGDAVGQVGFGIHGTIDEASIGQDVSMGCIRLAAKDIELVYKLLVPRQSTVIVRD